LRHAAVRSSRACVDTVTAFAIGIQVVVDRGSSRNC